MKHSSTLVFLASVPLLLLLPLCLTGCNRGAGDADSSAVAAIKAPSEKGTGEASRPASTPASQNKQTTDPLHPLVVLDTALGKVTLRLNAEKAPVTVRNFLSYVNAGFYDQTIVHQVFRDHGVVAGGYAANMAEKRGNMAIRNEAENGLKNVRGTIAMARSPDVIDSATSQFFLNVANNPSLDFRARTPDGCGYCVFGEVTEGMDVVDKMASVEVHSTRDLESTPVKPIIITSARQIR
jgi:cyclophilin family peptidyl-prolyl cis-trans isomerase